MPNPNCLNILDPNFRYTNAANTNIAATLKKFGHKVPDRKKQEKIRRQLNPLG